MRWTTTGSLVLPVKRRAAPAMQVEKRVMTSSCKPTASVQSWATSSISSVALEMLRITHETTGAVGQQAVDRGNYYGIYFY